MLNEIIRNKRLEEIKIWYSQNFVLYEIVKCLQNKELCFISDKTERELAHNVRYAKSHSVEYLKKHIIWGGLLRNLINVYVSVASFDFLPVMSFNAKKRTREDKYMDFSKNKSSHIIGYSFFCDFDGKNENFYEEAKEFKKILDEYRLPYYVLNSSSKGFHFVIDEKYLPKLPIPELIEKIHIIIKNIIKVYEFKCLDISIYDKDRVRKCPYSYVGADGTIALPLTDSQFENFSIELVLMKNVLKNIKIFNRGLLTRNQDLSEEQLKKNVLEFWGSFLE